MQSHAQGRCRSGRLLLFVCVILVGWIVPAAGVAATVRYAYDGNGNLVETGTPNGAVIRDGFDALGRRISRTISGGPVAPGEPTRVDYRYDGNSNLTAIIETLEDGRVLTSSREYDALDRLVTERDRYGRSRTYRYDNAGNRVASTDHDGRQTSYGYDAQNRLSSVLLESGDSVQYEYFHDGRLRQRTDPGGGTVEWAYDAAGRVERLTHAQNGIVVAQERYAFDANGNVREMRTINAAGGITAEQVVTYTYDQADRLLEVQYPDQSTTYTYDATGNRATEVTRANGDITSRKVIVYDERDRLISVEQRNAAGALISTSTYGYDENGNQVLAIEDGIAIERVHDRRDRLVIVRRQESAPSAWTRYEYSESGLRTAFETAATREQYVWDDDSLVATTNALGNTLAHYRWGADGVVIEEIPGSIPALHLYHLDTRSSPLYIADRSGSVLARYQWRVHGETWARAGVLSQPFAFNGYLLAGSADLLFAYARNYAPAQGRFTGVDPWQGDPLRPISLNKYLYANANPATQSDPDGRCGVFAMVLPFSAAPCQIADSMLLGVDPASIDGQIAIQSYRIQHGNETGKVLASGVLEALATAGDLIGSVVERATPLNIGSTDRTGERVAGIVDLTEHLPERATEKLAEYDWEVSQARATGDITRMAKANAPLAAAVISAGLPEVLPVLAPKVLPRRVVIAEGDIDPSVRRPEQRASTDDPGSFDPIFRQSEPELELDLARLSRREIGELGERRVVELLERNGYTDILPIQNASGHGLDIAARAPDGRIAFFEVKTSSAGKIGDLSPAQRDFDSFIQSRLEQAEAGRNAYKNLSPEQRARAGDYLNEYRADRASVSATVVGVDLASGTIRMSPWRRP